MNHPFKSLFFVLLVVTALSTPSSAGVGERPLAKKAKEPSGRKGTKLSSTAPTLVGIAMNSGKGAKKGLSKAKAKDTKSVSKGKTKKKSSSDEKKADGKAKKGVSKTTASKGSAEAATSGKASTKDTSKGKAKKTSKAESKSSKNHPVA